ncbi:MAG TPA: DUF3108 domain-containing protein [Vicinamibacterales bacterium]|nr:DUF3108 domain-containing protein [Vicinamibacterales bacterium]
MTAIRTRWGVALFYLAATLVATWPLVLHPFTRLFAPVGPGDPYLNLWILGWDLGTISADPLALLDGRIFDANIFFPAEGTLAYSDNLILPALVAWPLWAATGNLTFCYNALLFLSWWASALAMYAFVRAVTGSRTGALLAGLAWGFWPFRAAHLLHLQLQALYFLPLAFLFLHRLVAGRRRRDALALAAAAALQAIASVYFGVIGALGLAAGAVALTLSAGGPRATLARRFALTAAVGALLIAPVVWPYWQSQRREGFSRNLYEAARHSATPGSYLRVPPGNLLYGRTSLLRPADPASNRDSDRDRDWDAAGPERELFPGFVLLALAAYGAWRAWRTDSRPLAAAMLAVAATGLVFSLGPGGVRPLYAALHRFLLGFDAIRAPARFGVLVAFGAATLAGIGIREVLHRRGGAATRRSRIAAAALLALAAVEYVNIPLPWVPAPPESTPAGQWLARADGEGAVLYLPLDADAGNTPAMVASLDHRRPIVNGYSGQRPSFFMGLVDVLNRLPSPEALWALRDVGVRFVVSPAPLAAAPLVERARFPGAIVYEAVWTGEAEAAVLRPDPPPPPAAGPLPFAASERAVFDVMWLGGAGAGVPAGEATLTATRLADPRRGPAGHPDAAFHLTAELRTAPWVSRFFEARDRFDTWTDAALLPLRHEQHLREGRRVLDRATEFDHRTGTIRTEGGPPMRMPPGARDALSAFLYARTLPLDPGVPVTFPLVNSGRHYIVDLEVQGVESIEVQGRQVDALKLAPRVSSAGRQRRLSLTLFTTPDPRRVPLLILVDAGFGSFRLELRHHESR